MRWYKIKISDVTKVEYDTFLRLMTKERRDKISRLKRIDDKKRSVCGEMLAKRAIAEIMGADAKTLVFDVKKSGKPFCRNAEIEFSVSHSGEYAVCAVSEKPIGIDIQKIVPYKSAVAKRVCSDAELNQIESSENPSREFVKIWTKKEAVLKRDGKSIFSDDIKNCLAGKNVKTVEFPNYIVSICE